MDPTVKTPLFPLITNPQSFFAPLKNTLSIGLSESFSVDIREKNKTAPLLSKEGHRHIFVTQRPKTLFKINGPELFTFSHDPLQFRTLSSTKSPECARHIILVIICLFDTVVCLLLQNIGRIVTISYV